MHHRVAGFLIELLLVAMTAVFALLIRDNFETSPDRLVGILPYLVACVISAVIILPLLGTNRALWRLSASPGYLLALLASAGVVMSGAVIGFANNRLEGVARSLPILHTFLLFNAFSAVRMLARFRHERRSQPIQLRNEPRDEQLTTILIVGHGRLLEAYLRTFAEVSNVRMKVAGLLCPAQRLSGRSIVGQSVLGKPDDIEDVIKSLESHNVVIERVVIAMPTDRLSETDIAAIRSAQKTYGFQVIHLASVMGLEEESSHELYGAQNINLSSELRAYEPAQKFSVDAVCVQAQLRSRYWAMKRCMDWIAAVIFVVLLSPFFVFASILTLVDVGRPLVFWQRRPGLGGQMMRVYKFRTMKDQYDFEGHKIPDEARVSHIGRFMRRSRLDELPQLWNVLIGSMSIIGPRPLLPTDQAPEHAARLVVRPGLTGWAQVQGGRAVSPADKAALDVWYIMNASIWLDFKIAIMTARMLALGELENARATELAWRDLVAKGVCGPSSLPVANHDNNGGYQGMAIGASPAE